MKLNDDFINHELDDDEEWDDKTQANWDEKMSEPLGGEIMTMEDYLRRKANGEFD